MDLESEFDKFLTAEQLQLSPKQMRLARTVLVRNSGMNSWMRARRTGVTTLFNALEKFYKTHNIFK